MANTIRIKRRGVGGSAGAPASLATAELAFNEVDGVLYIGFGDNGAGYATSIPAIGGSGAYVTLGSSQTVSGLKDFSTVPTVSASLQNSDNSTKVATTQWVKALGYLTGNQTISLTGDATGSGSTSIEVTLANSGVAAGTYTKVTVDAKGRVTSATTLSASDIPTLTASKISDFDLQVRTSRLDQMAAPTTDVSWNGYKITGLANPINAQDAATKSYVDTAVQGLDIKASVRVASTTDVLLSAPGATIDGVSLSAGNRVLLLNQDTASQNGLWVWNGAVAAMTRPADSTSATVLTAGAFVFVEEGTNADNGFVLSTDNPVTVDVTAQTWVQFSGAGQITAGAGLTKTGNTLNVGGTADRITVGTDAVDIASTYAGQTSITTLGTISAGTWQASVVGLAYGGTGANLSAAADGAIFKKSGAALVAATEGTDYLSAASVIYGGTF